MGSTYVQDGKERFCLRKISGDKNVPAGRLSIDSESPTTNLNEMISTDIQLRDDTTNVNTFYWEPCELCRSSKTTLCLKYGGMKLIYKKEGD